MEGYRKEPSVPSASRQSFARAAFPHTADYDAAISNYFNQLDPPGNPAQLNLSLPLSATLRYGENPHQPASVYGEQSNYIDCFHGKELSYNNYLDIDSALVLMPDLGADVPAAAIVTHTLPCGVAIGATLTDAH